MMKTDTKSKSILIAALVVLCIFASAVTYFSAGTISQVTPSNQIVKEEASKHVTTNVFKNQRDELSKQLNEMKKHFGQQSCRVKKLRQKLGEQVDPRISQNGGWCEEMSGSDSDAHRFDTGFAKALSKFFKGKHVGSFGDGPGDYKTELDKLKEVASYTAYDGAPFCEHTTKGRVQFLDLSAPQYGLPSFDWVISVEVGEHIPQQFEDVYLDNLARHAKEGIVLSWAVPGQGGLSHVNNQPLEHVMAQMEKRGFRIHKDEGKVLRNASSFFWLKENVHIYRRINRDAFNSNFA